MGLHRHYNLEDARPEVFRQILETVQVARDSVKLRSVDESGQAFSIEASSEQALGYLDDLVGHALKSQRHLRRRAYRHTRGAGRFDGDIDAALERSPDVQFLGPGLAGLGGDVLRLFAFFESEFAELARRYGAAERRYPVMLPTDLLQELGYFEHFPHQVTFCCHLPEDLPLFERVATESGRGAESLRAEVARHLGAPEHALKPAVCLPCYRELRGRRLDPGERVVLSMQNHVFRYEGANFRSLSRLWDFTVRDVVLFGAGPDLETARAEIMEWAIGLCDELGLEARLELASDPFFLDGSRAKHVYQRLGEVKVELVVALPARGEDLAVSSFNLHRDFYTGRYGIELGEGVAESACMGFGLERWLYGFLSQWGLDPTAWPERVRAFARGDP